MESTVYVVIHGHFYQPPRENPWLESVERQPSAAPYHDWNERISAECYTPNAVSRILDPSGKIDAIVNNFLHVDFNVGPTLMAWLEKHSFRTYRRIIEGDRLSRSANNGHGNAIAQAYSHMIMPLAGDDDLQTQIVWGVQDFIFRYGREPEGMWLPETAVNNRVMAALAAGGIRFTILSPYQALAVRPLVGSGAWKDVADGSIDTRQAYRYFVKDASGKADPKQYVDVFFFDGALSRAVSFEHLMTSAAKFAAALRGGADARKGPQLVNVATDGETFGHHEPFADMCLAAFFDREAAQAGLRVVNYARYLEIAPPAAEVDLKPGPNGEGTAWSCAHGTGRWQRDCGCSTGGAPGWSQAWRAPLRRALDNLRTGLDRTFTGNLAHVLGDVEGARNDYITLLLDRREETQRKFFERHLKKDTPAPDKSKVLMLLESQKNAMYMYTSCGWFFAELSGLEAVQNMRYAARAIDLAEPYAETPLMQRFLTDLAEACSNVDEFRDGRSVFRRLVWPSMMTLDKIVAADAMASLVAGKAHVWQPVNHSVETLSRESLPDRYHSSLGLARCSSRTTLQTRLYAYYATQFTARDVRCYMKSVSDAAEYDALRERVASSDKAHLPEIFEGKFTSWPDLLPEISGLIMSVLVEKDLDLLRTQFTKLFQENSELFEALASAGLELPYDIRGLVKYALSALLRREVLARRGQWQPANFAQAAEYVGAAKRLGVDIDTHEVDSLVTEDLLAEAEAVRGDLSPRHLYNVVTILDVGGQLGLSLRRDLVENLILEVLEEKVVPWIQSLRDPQRDKGDYYAIMEILDYAERLNFSRRRYLAMLEPFVRASKP